MRFITPPTRRDMAKPQLLKIAALATLIVAQYDAWGNYQYLGYCQSSNVVYSYSITGRMEWP
jgi:hypothetical protein